LFRRGTRPRIAFVFGWRPRQHIRPGRPSLEKMNGPLNCETETSCPGNSTMTLRHHILEQAGCFSGAKIM